MIITPQVMLIVSHTTTTLFGFSNLRLCWSWMCLFLIALYYISSVSDAAPQCVLGYLLSERMLPLSEWGLPAPDIPLPAGLPPSDRWPPSSSSSSSSWWPRSEPLCCSASEWSLSPWSECMLASDWLPDRSEWLSLPLCWLCCSSSLSSPNSSCKEISWVSRRTRVSSNNIRNVHSVLAHALSFQVLYLTWILLDDR